MAWHQQRGNRTPRLGTGQWSEELDTDLTGQIPTATLNEVTRVTSSDDLRQPVPAKTQASRANDLQAVHSNDGFTSALPWSSSEMTRVGASECTRFGAWHAHEVCHGGVVLVGGALADEATDGVAQVDFNAC